MFVLFSRLRRPARACPLLFSGLSTVRKLNDEMTKDRNNRAASLIMRARSQAGEDAVYPTSEDDRNKEEAEIPHALQPCTTLLRQQKYVTIPYPL